jgi:hypothetical protein
MDGAVRSVWDLREFLSQSLSDRNIITLADKLHLLAFVFIFASIVESTVSLRLLQKGLRTVSERLDGLGRWTCLAVFVLLGVLSIRFR